MLLWIEQATIDVVLCASSVSMLVKLPILIVPPYFGLGAWAKAARASGPAPARPIADQPRAVRTARRFTSLFMSWLTTSNPSRDVMGILLPCRGDRRPRAPAPSRSAWARSP